MDLNEDGQSRPKFTKTPNVLFDELFGLMKQAELRITLALVRQTVGFHRERVSLSIADFQKLTGLSRQGVINGIEEGIARKTVVRDADGSGGFFYGLELDEGGSQRSRLVNFVDYHSGPELVNLVDPPSQLNRLVHTCAKDRVSLVSSLSKKLSVRKKTNYLPKPAPATEGQPLEPMQQLALGLLTDGEVGVFRWVAELIVRKLPAQDIYRAVDQWLPANRKGKTGPGLLADQLKELMPSDAPTVALSATFRDSDLFHRHRLPDEMVAEVRRSYSLDGAFPDDQERRRKYNP